MSRAVKQDFEPNYDGFRKKVLLAKGTRTLSQFCADAGVNQTYLSKLISSTYGRPATPSFIGKLARVADNGVTFQALMRDAGYDPDKHSDFDVKSGFDKQLKDSYDDGYIRGFMDARNAVFDVMNAGGNYQNIFSVLCRGCKSRDNLAFNALDVFVSGAVVEKSETKEQFILVSVFKDGLWLALSPEGKTEIVKEEDIKGTGHFVPSDLVLAMYKNIGA